MTKQTKTLTVLAAALVVCGGAYAALRVWNDRQAQMDDTVYVTQLSDLTVLSLINGQGELSFTKAEDVWQYDGDDAFPADQEAVEDLAEQIGSLAAIRVIDDPEDLSAYGLDEPALQATVTAGDGTAVTLLLGDVSDSYCYAKRADSDTVYTSPPNCRRTWSPWSCWTLPPFPTSLIWGRTPSPPSPGRAAGPPSP